MRKLFQLKPREWHRVLPSALFAMREIPSDSLGFSPFELIYGRQVRGPLAVLADLWSEPELTEDLVNSFRFILELRDRLVEVSELAAENLRISSSKYKTYFDLKCSKRKLKIGDEVLMLKPEKRNQLQMTWSGPYKVVGKRGNVDYYVDIDGNTKLYLNMSSEIIIVGNDSDTLVNINDSLESEQKKDLRNLFKLFQTHFLTFLG